MVPFNLLLDKLMYVYCVIVGDFAGASAIRRILLLDEFQLVILTAVLPKIIYPLRCKTVKLKLVS